MIPSSEISLRTIYSKQNVHTIKREICGKNELNIPIRSSSNFEVDEKLKTVRSEETYRCNNCPYTVLEKHSLIKHLKKCCKIYDFRCPYYDYSTLTFSTEILNHIKSEHNGLYIYCKASYENATNSLRLKSAKRSGSNIAQFTCNFCPSRFITKSRLI